MVLERDSSVGVVASCQICASPRSLDVHHIEPRRMGGSSRPEIEAAANKITICRSCHTEITENRWHLERSDRELRVTKVETGEVILRRLYDPGFDPSSFFHQLNLIDLHLDALVLGIPYLADDQLVELFQDLRSIDKQTWKAQAAILWEAKQRSVYGDRAWEAMGRTFGIGWRHAYNLARVWETFFKGEDGQYCNRLQSSSLQEVTWYIVASEAESPPFWLSYAEDQKAFDPAYSISDFKDDIRLAGAKAEEESPYGDGESRRCRYLRMYCMKLDRAVRPGECPGCDYPPNIEERLR